MLICGLASSAGASEPPKVLETHTGETFAKYYPEHATQLELSGTVTLDCVSTDAGLLKSCRTTHEWPMGFGFAEAALHLTPFFRLSGPGPFKTHIRFRLDGNDDRPLYLQAPGPRNVWPVLSRPTEQQLAAAYPGYGVEVLSIGLTCTLTADGRLDGCVSFTSRTPPKALAAARQMAALYRTNPPPAELVGKTTTFAIVFVPPDPGEGLAPKPAQ